MAKSKSKLNLSRLIENNKFLLAISVIIAVISWLTVNISQNSTVTKTITDVTLNITTAGTSIKEELGLDIVSGGTNQKVDVKVSGPNSVISTLTAQDLLVSADLSVVTAAGKYTLELKAERNKAELDNVEQNTKTTGDFVILGVTPSTIEVTFDKVEKKTFTPKINAVEATASKGLVIGDLSVVDAKHVTIDVSGPAIQLAKIDSIELRADVNEELSTTKNFDAIALLLDKEGAEIPLDAFTLSYETTKITVPVWIEKTVPVEATFVNMPEMFNGTTVPYTLAVPEVSIMGPTEVVTALEKIELEPIDFDSISSESQKFTCALRLPIAVKNVDSIAAVEVTLNLGNVAEKTVVVSAVTGINVPNGIKVEMAQNIKNVIISGNADVINAINDGLVYAEIDLKDKVPGEYNILARIKIKDPANNTVNLNNIWQVGSYSVHVVITK